MVESRAKLLKRFDDSVGSAPKPAHTAVTVNNPLKPKFWQFVHITSVTIYTCCHLVNVFVRLSLGDGKDLTTAVAAASTSTTAGISGVLCRVLYLTIVHVYLKSSEGWIDDAYVS